MSKHEEVILEIRRRIKDGTTVSKCLQVIQDRFKVDRTHSVGLLLESFCLGPGLTQKAVGSFQRTDASSTQNGLATFLLLPEIVRLRGRWDEKPDPMSDHWFELLSCSSIDSIKSQALGSIEGDKDWNNAPTGLREQFMTAECSRLFLSEFGEIVARLAERLQRRIDELETELAQFR